MYKTDGYNALANEIGEVVGAKLEFFRWEVGANRYKLAEGLDGRTELEKEQAIKAGLEKLGFTPTEVDHEYAKDNAVVRAWNREDGEGACIWVAIR